METAQAHPEIVGIDPSISEAHVGVVKWFNPGKGYGFIAPEEGGNDIFVHISAVQRAGLRKLTEGQRTVLRCSNVKAVSPRWNCNGSIEAARLEIEPATGPISYLNRTPAKPAAPLGLRLDLMPA